MNSMKLTWLRRNTTTDSPWQSIIKGTINFNEIFSFGASYIESLLPKIKNKFWTDVLKAYSEMLKLKIKLIMKTLFSPAQFSITMKLRLEIIQYA